MPNSSPVRKSNGSCWLPLCIQCLPQFRQLRRLVWGGGFNN